MVLTKHIGPKECPTIIKRKEDSDDETMLIIDCFIPIGEIDNCIETMIQWSNMLPNSSSTLI